MDDACEVSTLTIPALLPYAQVASAYVQAVAGQAGFQVDQIRELAQSLSIILRDLISRAFSPEDRQDVQISCRVLPLGLKIIISEQGLPLSEAELPSLAADPRSCPFLRLRDHLSCVREVWDEAAFHHLGRAGGEVELLKYFAAAPQAHDQVCRRELPSAAPVPATGTPETFTVRSFSPTDAQEIIRLLYRTYGYSYPFENMYYPDRLVALNIDGSLQSLVAVSADDNVVGHLALFFSKENPSLAELGAAIVHPDFRGHGCLAQLAAYALAEAGRRQLQALYGRPVTTHIYSQKVSEDLGFVPCGLLVGLGPTFLSFKAISETISQRESMLLIYRSLGPMPGVKIFPPPRHREMILRLYAGLGLTPDTADAGDDFSPPDTSAGNLDVNLFNSGGVAVIRMKAVGPDSLEHLRHNLKHLCQAHFQVILLHLDLCQAATAPFVPSCESLGFFFAGILPGLNHTHTLILQYLNNVPLDYGKIQLHSPQAREIRDYVKQADPNRI